MTSYGVAWGGVGGRQSVVSCICKGTVEVVLRSSVCM